MTPDSTPLNPDADLFARLGRALAPAYEMDGELGRGGMAIVYRARDLRLKRPVAIKLLPPDLAFRADIRSRFLREAETAARLNHPNIVPIYAVDERDGLVYFVMALIHGGSVGDRLRKAGAMPAADVRPVLRGVAAALAYAHRNGVVHRDIKPDNVLLDDETGRAMVTDFGIARAASQDDGGSRLTATGAAIGTPAYMSPEQCAGDPNIDGRSDLYSLGTVAYHMLAGAPPFSGASTPAVMLKQVTERAVPVRERRADVPEDLERIVMKLLEKDPARRFADGDALVAALDGAPVTPVDSLEPAGPRKYTVEVGVIAGRHAIREAARSSRREWREARRALRDRDDAKPLPLRIRSFRKRLVSYVGTSAMLFGINYMTGTGFWWCAFPILGIGLGVAKEMGGLWADGVRLRDIFGGALPQSPAGDRAAGSLEAALTPAALPAMAGVSEALLEGPHGEILRQAIADRGRLEGLVAKLTVRERNLLPDVAATAESLYQRIVALATALDRLDGQIGTERATALDERIARIEQQSDGPRDRERQLTLLRRQRDMLADLVTSRSKLLEQYETAGLMLQNLALDLLKARSAGLDSALAGVTSATQEARALSREIGYVLGAAEELRDLERNATSG